MQGKISADSLTAVIFVVLVSKQVYICILFAYEQSRSDGFSRDRSFSHAQVLHAKCVVLRVSCFTFVLGDFLPGWDVAWCQLCLLAQKSIGVVLHKRGQRFLSLGTKM